MSLPQAPRSPKVIFRWHQKCTNFRFLIPKTQNSRFSHQNTLIHIFLTPTFHQLFKSQNLTPVTGSQKPFSRVSSLSPTCLLFCRSPPIPGVRAVCLSAVRHQLSPIKTKLDSIQIFNRSSGLPISTNLEDECESISNGHNYTLYFTVQGCISVE